MIIEETVEWSLPQSQLFSIDAKSVFITNGEIKGRITVEPNFVRADDFEKGSRKLAIPH